MVKEKEEMDDFEKELKMIIKDFSSWVYMYLKAHPEINFRMIVLAFFNMIIMGANGDRNDKKSSMEELNNFLEMFKDLVEDNKQREFTELDEDANGN